MFKLWTWMNDCEPRMLYHGKLFIELNGDILYVHADTN